MRSGAWIVMAALMLAAGIAAHGGLYQLVGAGPEAAYLVHRWTGEVRFITGASSRPVRAAAPAELDRDFRK